jgi:hypothetical protein
MILQILVSQRQAKHPLPNQRTHSVLDQLGAAMVGKATGQPVDQADGRIGLAQQQGAGIAADRAAVKRGYNFCWPGPVRRMATIPLTLAERAKAWRMWP